MLLKFELEQLRQFLATSELKQSSKEPLEKWKMAVKRARRKEDDTDDEFCLMELSDICLPLQMSHHRKSGVSMQSNMFLSV